MVVGRRARALALSAVVALAAAAALPGALSAPAGAAGETYSVHSAKLPDGQLHRIRWDPCTTITYAANVRYAGGSPRARAHAEADVQEAMARAARRTGLTFKYVGRTTEIPKDAGASWSDRQSAAEIVIAWVDQSRSASSSNLLMSSGGSSVSGTGGWVWKAWTMNGAWQLAIGRGFVVLNAADNRRYVPGFGSGYTRGALLMHEIGHALGLDHVGSTRELMYPQMLDRKAATYKAGDRTGLEKVGDTLGCIPGAAQVWKQI
jgi:hypothetical protein